ncbi:hyaluronan synthase 2-like [Branchiostoma floridae]|uniref:Hyaluronan synthase 2-like n=1 Tax=Branchiostoma floridae TaxID=7739 RepID=A0A9J7KPF3_BRAFL|nr:hyaluronan synthase 2-like [Branchiostoma floridae]XP_035667619.1 hyaluronan synthase 2-like [Branchiostoma floridae]
MCSWRPARIALTGTFLIAVLVGMVAVYSTGYSFIASEDSYFAFGLYGAVMCVHLIIQSVAALIEHYRISTEEDLEESDRVIGLVIAAYQEDPELMRHCLISAKTLKYPKMKIVMVVDGNRDEDFYMKDIFVDIMGKENTATFFWQHNFHTFQSDSIEEVSADPTEQLVNMVRSHQYSCILQEWGGKREALYTGFKALGDTVDYVQVCDSDTILDPMCAMEMAKILDKYEDVGAAVGDVRILNKMDSLISFLSSLRYWMAFNVERASQSFFNCVTCISGPLGLYRSTLIQQVLDHWYEQSFCGSKCTFGDDRHLTNRVLSLGYGTKFTWRASCLTETPSTYLRWLNQQTRWCKSYYREWLYNALWFHKHSLWMTYDSVFSGLFPVFLTITTFQLVYRGKIWNILLLLHIIQVIGIVKSIYAFALSRRPIMLFMSIYSLLYFTSLLPSKFFALCTIGKTSWGTSGRKKIIANYIPLVPLSIWFTILLGGCGYTAYQEWGNPFDRQKQAYLIIGTCFYTIYWLCMTAAYIVYKARHYPAKEYHVLASQRVTEAAEEV